MATLLPLYQLARLFGVQTSYYNIAGQRHPASAQALIAVLRALRAPLEGLKDVPAALRERRQALGRRPLEPVAVAWEGKPLTLKLRLPSSLLETPLSAVLTEESGQEHRWGFRGADLPDLGGEEVEGIRYGVKGLPLPSLPYGYHRLLLELSGGPVEALLIAAPLQAHPPPQERSWGVFLPLYALYSGRSWGSGDFSDLEALIEWVSGRGGGAVATLPLLPTFLEEPFDPSPYAPVSRLFWNEFYIDVTRAPELPLSPGAQALLESSALQEELQALRPMELVDYRRLMALKRRVLEELARTCFELPPQREALLRFAQAHPALEDYARFRAAGEGRRTPWRAWPPPLQDGVLGEGDYAEENRRYHLYVQGLAGQQVQGLYKGAGERGVGLYFDLPLGVHPNGYDVWRERGVFAQGVSAGAPPDSFFLKGQVWGFPPLHPERLRQQGYRYYIACLRHHLQYARLLRIDHVMGFHRLFWVPQGMEAREGVYVRYPAQEFYALLALESRRHQALIVGEDLGTVPPEVRPAMARHALLRSYVAQYEATPNPSQALPLPSPPMVAGLNTHDMPPSAAFWEGLDIGWRQEMGLLEGACARQERERRQALKEALSHFLQQGGWGPGGNAQDTLKALLSFLSASPAHLVLVNLEDLWQETRPQNLPGTGQERPNWRRKARHPLEVFSFLPPVVEGLRLMNRGRGADSPPVRYDITLLTEEDLYLFNQGTHFRLYQKLGAHPLRAGVGEGTYFAVWAPNAQGVWVMGDFNSWDKAAHPLRPRGSSGLWEGFLPGVGKGDRYKFHILSPSGYKVDKADPLGQLQEPPPRTASIVWGGDYPWGDREWMEERGRHNSLNAPIAIYEVHLGSWRRVPEEGGRPLTYRELARPLADYVKEMGFTHVEFLPVMEHPFYGSWGYQTTGYFAPTSRYGTPQDLMFLIDHLHQQGIGVILDWVPSHFPTDEHGLGFFDGTHLYEHADPRLGRHPDWDSFIFNYGRQEVRSFLISSALFYLDQFHADGLRLDAVASMLYLDYSRKEGEWLPNPFGGRENLEAIAFLRRLNEEVYKSFPDCQTIAEESTAWPMVSRPTYVGGLGFGLKWDMGWMHDTLWYMTRDPVHRKHHHHQLTFRMLYAHTENFLLALSHDEVVHGKGSLLEKMPGDAWQKFANLRLLLGYMFAQPGKKLLFMGGEFGQRAEWHHDKSLDWHLLAYPPHQGVQRWVQDLLRLYRSEPALYERDLDPAGFEWVDCHDVDNTILTFLRQGSSSDALFLICCNFTPVPRFNYRVGVPRGGFWGEVLNSDAREYGGGGLGNLGGAEASPIPTHSRPYSLSLTLPPLCALFLRSRP